MITSEVAYGDLADPTHLPLKVSERVSDFLRGCQASTVRCQFNMRSVEAEQNFVKSCSTCMCRQKHT